ncbi:hypothetical protein DPMN_190543 [Dreissena polymorpha]|uniref:Uncharacterized protein n=1 Tax=Dreissena polymorpha TaxID=45954 RepID=A0A9D4IC23_DREPO|nr:hypothetical protein DPMN_190543 [Dreissena polymorpha]
MASVNDRNKHVVKESEWLQLEMEREEQMARAASLAQKELEEEKKRMEEDLESLKGQRDRMFQVAGRKCNIMCSTISMIWSLSK